MATKFLIGSVRDGSKFLIGSVRVETTTSVAVISSPTVIRRDVNYDIIITSSIETPTLGNVVVTLGGDGLTVNSVIEDGSNWIINVTANELVTVPYSLTPYALVVTVNGEVSEGNTAVFQPPVGGVTLKLIRGDTAKNDLFTGPDGSLSIDTELKELRIHDGLTQGGFVVGRKNVWIGTLEEYQALSTTSSDVLYILRPVGGSNVIDLYPEEPIT